VDCIYSNLGRELRRGDGLRSTQWLGRSVRFLEIGRDGYDEVASYPKVLRSNQRNRTLLYSLYEGNKWRHKHTLNGLLTSPLTVLGRASTCHHQYHTLLPYRVGGWKYDFNSSVPGGGNESLLFGRGPFY